jgi:transposase
VRERAVRLVFDQVKVNEPTWPTIVSVLSKIGCTPETLKRWLRQTERDKGEHEGLTTDDREEHKRLQREKREPEKANEILRLASAFCAQTELDCLR